MYNLNDDVELVSSKDARISKRLRTVSQEDDLRTLSQRSKSSNRSSNDMSAILNEFRGLEDRVVGRIKMEMELLLDAKLACIRTDFDAKLVALSDSVDKRITDAIHNSTKSLNDQINDANSITNSIALISDLRSQSLERIQFLQDAVITNIPFTVNEDVHAIYIKICEVTGFRGGAHSISSVFRLPNKNNAAESSSSTSSITKGNKFNATPIIVKFVNVDFCRQFISAYLKFKSLNLTHLGFSTSIRIYINENLTKPSRDLFRYCMNLKSNHKSLFLKLFTRNGLVFVLFAGLEKPVIINSKKEIDSLILNFNVVQPSTV